MRSGTLLGSSSNAARPRRPGSASSNAFASTASSTSTHHSSHYNSQSAADQENGDTLMSNAVQTEEEQQEGQDEGYSDPVTEQYAPGEFPGGEDDEEEDEDEDEDDDLESLDYPHHQHHYPHHCDNHQHHSQPQPQPHHHHQSPHHYFEDLSGYISDDLDMSDDAGVPLVNYLNVAQMLTNNMDLDASADSSSDVGFGLDGPNNLEDNEDNSISSGLGLQFNDPSIPDPSLGFVGLLPLLQPPVHPLSPLSPTGMPGQPDQFLVDTEADEAATAAWFDVAHPIALSNPNPLYLGSNNHDLNDFLHIWARQSRRLSGLTRERGRYPWPSRINELTAHPPTNVQYADLEGDLCDLQGIDWEDLGVTRKEARERRLLTYKNYVSKQASDRWTPHLPDLVIPRTENFFRFRRMDIRSNVRLSHFQLRNVLGAASRTQTFYPVAGAVQHFNPVSGESRPALKVNDKVTALAADHDVLVAGCFNGEYAYRHLDPDEPESTACHDGIITSNNSGITNHVQVHQVRGSSSPVAAFASNDMYFRVLDLATETWLSSEKFPFPLNCTALSPDRRLRVMVGDNLNVIITTADSTLSGRRPEVVQCLAGHRDYGFSCDWADDGWTVATGFQDKSIKIWDARRWTDSSGYATPVRTLRAEMAGVRALRFSPVGSGRRVLVAAEEADFVNIIDAQSFMSKQTVDVFSEIGGITFTNDGQDLAVLCCDQSRGGLLQLERCNTGRESTWNLEGLSSHSDYQEHQGTDFDWPRSQFTEEKRVKETLTRRRRKAAALDDLEPF